MNQSSQSPPAEPLGTTNVPRQRAAGPCQNTLTLDDGTVAHCEGRDGHVGRCRARMMVEWERTT